MQHREYWKKRFIMLEEAQSRKGVAFFNELEKQFQIAATNIEKEITKWYLRFASENDISLYDAKRILKGNELEEFRWSVEEYIKYGKENALDGQWMKQLEKASVRVHINRLEALKLQIQQQVEMLYGYELDEVDNLARTLYKEGYYHTAYEIQKGFNIGWSLMALDENKISKIISTPWAVDSKSFSERIWTSKAQLINTLHTELTQSIIRGEAPDRVIKVIAKKFETSKNNAGRLVMTESAFFSSAAQKDCFNDLDVEQFEFVATLDSHTSATCQSMDGKVFDMKDYEVGINAPPLHVFCRSVTVPYFDDNVGYRAARDEKGKTTYIPSDISYNEWHNTFVQSNPDMLLQEMKIKNKTVDKNQFQQYRAVLGNKIPLSFEKFQNIKYNNDKQWVSLQNEYGILNKIQSLDPERASEAYKQRMIDAYYQLKNEGYEAIYHALTRIAGQKTGKGKRSFAVDELIDILKKKPNYIEVDKNRTVKYYDGIAAIQNADTGELVSIVTLEKPKKGWELYEKGK